MAAAETKPVEKTEKRAFITFTTNDKYVDGVKGLSIGLGRTKTPYPLIVLYHKTVNLELLQKATSTPMSCKCILKEVEPFVMPEGFTDASVVDYWGEVYTKLKIWEEDEYDKLVYFDADIMIMKNLDELFDTPLQNGRCSQYEIACVSNCFHTLAAQANKDNATCPASYPLYLDHDRGQTLDHPLYAKEYGSHTCNWNVYKGPLTKEKANRLGQSHDGGRENDQHGRYFNSGCMVLVPSKEVFADMRKELSVMVKRIPDGWKYVDQDFLNLYFKDKWRSMDSQYNCHKKVIRWHPRCLAEAKVVHYILHLKPWMHERGTPGLYGLWQELDDLWWSVVDGDSDEKVIESARACGMMHNCYSEELSKDPCRLGGDVQEKWEMPKWLNDLHTDAIKDGNCVCTHNEDGIDYAYGLTKPSPSKCIDIQQPSS